MQLQFPWYKLRSQEPNFWENSLDLVLGSVYPTKEAQRADHLACLLFARVYRLSVFFLNWNFGDYGPALLLLDSDEYLDSIFNDGIL